MSICRHRMHPDCPSHGRFSGEDWELLKSEYDKIKAFLILERDIERFQNISRWVLLRRIPLATGFDLARKINPKIGEFFSEFMFRLCGCFYIDLSKYTDKQNGDIPDRHNISKAIFALKALQYNVHWVDSSLMDAVPHYLENAGNILLKDILEEALKLLPVQKDHVQDTDLSKLTARDLLDSFILNSDPNALHLNDGPFVNLKKKLAMCIDKSNVSSYLKSELQFIESQSIVEADEKINIYIDNLITPVSLQQQSPTFEL